MIPSHGNKRFNRLILDILVSLYLLSSELEHEMVSGLNFKRLWYNTGYVEICEPLMFSFMSIM